MPPLSRPDRDDSRGARLARLPFGRIAASITVVVAIGIIVAPRLHGPVSPETLTLSVERVIEGRESVAGPMEGCTEQRTGRWRCAVFGPSARPAHYDVRIRDGSCWTARLLSGDRSADREPSGCVLCGDSADDSVERPGGPRRFPSS
jgi:hypothetical protein